MRTLLILALVLLTPVSAQAGTIAREGTELVYRSAPGEADQFSVEGGDVTVVAEGNVTAGAGCRAGEYAAYCPAEGVTLVRVLAGDGDDEIVVLGGNVVADLGPGDDEFAAGTRSTAVDGGPGHDEVILLAEYGASGPQHAEGGEGDDELSVVGRHGAVTLSGGPGNDRLTTEGQGTPGIAFACGPGDDTYTVGPRDRPGDGCAPFLAGITAGTVSRAFQEGALTAAAYGWVSLRWTKGRYDRPREVLARGVFTAEAGPLRVSLERTAFGRRHKAARVHVTVRLRSGAERGTIVYRSKLGDPPGAPVASARAGGGARRDARPRRL
jgi:hypothetical protein